jgi:hypothetical protein
MSLKTVESAALDRARLENSFAAGAVGLKLLGAPMEGGNAAIFQMNVRRSPRFGEYVQIWPGDRKNEIEVVSHDRSRQQVVLRVQESRRRYLEYLSRPYRARTRGEAEAYALKVGGRILDESPQRFLLERWTPEVDRRYLCGRDDIHLFVAQVKEAATVAEAHASLKPEAVEKARPGSVLRQGEWFFLEPSHEERARLDRYLRDFGHAVQMKASLGSGGRPHLADFAVRIDHRVRSQNREYRRPEVFARGNVVHPDHRSLSLLTWRKVLRNNEIGGDRATGGMPGRNPRRIQWID